MNFRGFRGPPGSAPNPRDGAPAAARGRPTWGSRIVTGTAGWYLARDPGYLELPYPAFEWVAAALAIVVVLTIQGIFILLPTNLLVYLELRKPAPDGGRIARWMRTYVRVVALQDALQIAIIVVMARFVTGL